jgi:EpsI family protein
MQNAKVLTLTTLILLAVAVAACALVPRVQSNARLLPIGRMPRQFGGWSAGPDLPTDPDVQRQLPTAHILERNYTNAQGNVANLMLVTATYDEDFHKPTACLPAQGWILHDRAVVEVAGQPVNALIATRDNNGYVVYYYWVKLKGTPPPPHSLLATALALRKRVMREEMSLFVRIVMPDTSELRPDLTRFTGEVWSALQPMLEGNGEVVLRS